MRALVTGATGFLGGALARRLQSDGWQVTGMGRRAEAGAALEADGVRFLYADLTDQAAVAAACAGQDVVFHCGALSAMWGRKRDFFAANVLGTANVITGCRTDGVGRLVYVSTPSISFTLRGGLKVPEDAPLPTRAINRYTHSKRLAEALIDRAFQDGLPVITLRPRAIFGPGDTSILPRLLERLAAGRMIVIGDGQTVCDLTYIDNAVEALVMAARSPSQTLGRAYNITNDEPVRLWEMIRRLCEALGYAYPRRAVPYAVADALATALEAVCDVLPGHPEPPLTRYAVSVLAHSATLDISAARRDLGYVPRVSMEEGFERLVHWWKDTHR